MSSRSRLATIQALLARRRVGHLAHYAALNLTAGANRYYLAHTMREVRLEAAREAQRLADSMR